MAASAHSRRPWAALAYIGLIAGPFGTWCVIQATATLPTVVSSVGFLTTPAISLLLANLLLGEPITAGSAGGVRTDHLRRRLRCMADAAMMLHAIEAGHGDPPLVLLHGLFGSARNFGTVQRAFAQHRRTIALDLRNHGASPHADDMRYATMAADVLHTLEQLGALPAMLLGHSMGGKTAMQAALLRPDAVARLIVADIAPVPYPPHLRATAEAMVALPLVPGMTRAQADAALAGCGAGRRRARVPAAEPAAWRDARLAHRHR